MIEPLIGRDRRRVDVALLRHWRDEHVLPADLHVDALLPLLHRADDLRVEHALVIGCGLLRVAAADMDVVIGESAHRRSGFFVYEDEISASFWLPSHWPFALHGHARAGARVRPVVPHRAVLGAAVVPERDCVLAPAEAALEQRVLAVLIEI